MADITYQDKQTGDQFTASNANEIKTAVNSKVDKVTGKGLSTEDYTTAEKSKLTALPTNAELTTTLAGKVNINGTDRLMTAAEGTKLAGIAENANNYTLPTAAADTLGGIKVGARLTITDGVLSADEQGGSLTYASQAEAEAGTENTKVMTALRVFQSIAAWVLGDLTGLIVNTAISAGDTIKVAFGYLQGQINELFTRTTVGDDLTLTTGSNAIDLTNNITGKQYALYDMASGALTLTAAANPKTGGFAWGIIRADGSTLPDVSAFTLFSGIYDNTNDIDNHFLIIRKNGVNYIYWSKSDN